MTRTQVLESLVKRAAKESYMQIKGNSPELLLVLGGVNRLGEKIRPFEWRYMKAWDYRRDVIRLLIQSGLNFIEGNDAPRGGKEGSYVIITEEQ